MLRAPTSWSRHISLPLVRMNWPKVTPSLAWKIRMNRAASQFRWSPLSLGPKEYLVTMDNFTLFVVGADIVMVAAFIALMVLDKPPKPAPIEPVKPAGKKPA